MMEILIDIIPTYIGFTLALLTYDRLKKIPNIVKWVKEQITNYKKKRNFNKHKAEHEELVKKAIEKSLK